MAGPDRIEGYAIVSADGMIADANGVQPDALKPEADQRFFYAALEKADAVVHGRHSAEGGPAAAGRKRLIATRAIRGALPDPDNPNAVLWNPETASLHEAWALLRRDGGRLVVIGGTELFGHFLGRYDAFWLTTASRVRLPGGRPVFPGVPPASPQSLLKAASYRADAEQILDPAEALTLTVWRR